MEIIIEDPTYDKGKVLGKKLLAELKEKIYDLEKEFEIKNTDIGHGADWPVYLITIGGIFLLGERIEKNLKAWISLSRKFLEFINWIKEKHSFRLDEQGAILIAVDDLAQNFKIEHLSILFQETLVFDSIPNNQAGDLDKKPGSLYIFAFKINNEVIRIYGLKSKGSIEFSHEFSTHFFDF